MYNLKYLAKIKSGDSISSNELIQAGIYEVYGGNGLMGYCNKNNVNGFNIIIGRVGALCGNVRRGPTIAKGQKSLYSIGDSLRLFDV